MVSLLSTVPSWRDQAAGLPTLTPAHHTHNADKLIHYDPALLSELKQQRIAI